MDKFVSITKQGASTKGNGKPKNSFKYNPYPIPQAKERQVEAWRDRKKTEKILAPLRGDSEKTTRPASSKVLTKHLLNTLKDTSNPITHSTVGQRSDHVDSCVTGHQRSDGPGRPTAYFKSRNKKLEEQRQDKGRDEHGVLEGIRVYVGGYMSGTTDIEMKRVVTQAGGKIMHTAVGATHILTSQGLSGAKTHKYLHSNAKNKAHVVRPEWVLDSIRDRKRKKEWEYTVIKDSTVYGLGELGIGSSTGSGYN